MNNIRQIIKDSRCLLHESLFSLNKGEQVSSAGQDPHLKLISNCCSMRCSKYLVIKPHFKAAIALQCVYQGSLFLFSLKTVNKKIWRNLGEVELTFKVIQKQ